MVFISGWSARKVASFTLYQFVPFKDHWRRMVTSPFGVSAQAFNIRLKELSLITGAKHAEFARRIEEHYAQSGYGEPMPDAAIPGNRAGDLAALGRP